MFHPAYKLVVITEHFLCEKVCSIIEASGCKGYTIVPAGGKGQHYTHPMVDKATVVEGFDNIKIEVVISKLEQAQTIAERVLEDCLKEYPGIMYVEDVHVCRPERF